MSSRRPSFIVFVVTLALGVFAAVYGSRPPLWIRHTLGDVAAAGWVFAALGLLRPASTRTRRMLTAAAIAGLVEGVQALELVGADAPVLLHLTLGSTFDPLDLVAYGVGVLLAGGFEARLSADGNIAALADVRSEGPHRGPNERE